MAPDQGGYDDRTTVETRDLDVSSITFAAAREHFARANTCPARTVTFFYAEDATGE
jgi:hypothetical protein